MRPQLSAPLAAIAIAIAMVALLAGGCRGPTYRPPGLGQPSALLKVRVINHTRPSNTVEHKITLGKYHLASRSGAPTTRWTRAVRVHPRAAVLRVGTSFSKMVSRSVRESYTETRRENCGMKSERYACGTTRGYGKYSSSSTKYCTRYVTKYCNRTKTKYRYVTKRVRVDKGTCKRALQLLPQAGDILLVELDFYSASRCRIRCYRQLPGEDGQFTMLPCGG